MTERRWIAPCLLLGLGLFLGSLVATCLAQGIASSPPAALAPGAPASPSPTPVLVTPQPAVAQRDGHVTLAQSLTGTLPYTPPQLVANTGLTLPLGATRVIGPAQLQVTDAESGPEAITYTLRAAPTHGALLLDGITLTVGATFTQAAIDTARVRYAHDGMLAPGDSFTFTATDAGEPMALVSVSSAGDQGNGGSGSPALSADGRFVAFMSSASNLVPDDTNGTWDVFVCDRLTGQITRVSVSSAGEQGNSASSSPALSTDGRFVAFVSGASNLVPGDTNGTEDIFVYDRLTGQTERISVSSAGEQGDGASSSPALSTNGRFVAFRSDANNLAADDSNGVTDVFVHDRFTAQTERISVSSAGDQGNDWSSSPALSADGRFVAFYSYASNLVPGDTNENADVFVRDRLTGQTTRVSVNSAGDQGDSWSYHATLSVDGRYAAFCSSASNLVPGDTNGWWDVFVHDRLTGQTTRVSVNSAGVQGDDASCSSALSTDGRYVGFDSGASNLVPGDTNGTQDIFVYDRLTGQTERVSVSSTGDQGNGDSSSLALSADGRYVAFCSTAGNLMPDDTNGTADVFVHDRGVILATFPIHLALPDVTLNMAASAAFVTPGQPITYTLSFSNTWISTATGVLLTDVVPSAVTGLGHTSSGATVTPFPGSRYAWQVQDLAPGAGGVITLTGIVSPAPTGAAALINTATITCALDAEAANNTAQTWGMVLLSDMPPQLVANTGLALPLGATCVIGPAQLQVTDAESGPEAITYTLCVAPSHGALLLDGVTLTLGATFTQAAIDAAQVRYVHDGMLAPGDSFTFSATDAGEPTMRVSVSSASDQGNDQSYSPALSADGRYVAFCSAAGNLVPGDTNGRDDVFLHDRLTGHAERVSVSSAGEQGNRSSSSPSLCADGRYVAFYSTANNLVPGDTNGTGDIFLRDRLTGQTTRVSLSSTGAQGNGASSSPALSADGRFVAFASGASNLVPGDTNGKDDVFLYDRLTGRTTRVSVSSAGDQGNDRSYSPALSADGRFVAFASGASNLVPGDTNGKDDVFLYDRLTGRTARVSVSSAGDQGNDRSYSPALSADGRFVAFASGASNLVPGDTNGKDDVFLYDRLTGRTAWVSVSSAGEQGNDRSYSPVLSTDGRYVAFYAAAGNLVPGDSNGGVSDVFVHDRFTAQTTRVSVSSAGDQGNGESSHPTLSVDGRFVAFESLASNLVPGDTNGTGDIFLRDRGVILATFPIHLALPDVTLNMAASAAFVTPGQPITYTLSFSNTWISTATGVLLTDVVPSTVTGLSYTSSGATVTPFPGSRYAWQVQDLAPGAGGVITLTGIVSPALTGATDFVINTATITCALDAEAANDTARTLAIVWLPDTPPQLVANTGLRLPLGATRAIGPAQLHMTDAESGPEAITYTLRVAPSHGALLLDGITLTVGATFTQAAIDTAQVRYAHDGVLAPGDSFTFSATDAGEPIVRVSVSSAGEQGNGESLHPTLSADGRYTAFESQASNFVPGDSNGVKDVFVNDRLTGQTERISVSSAGVQGNGRSWLPALSADGRYVAFCSEASNLVPGDSNGWQDVFLRDRLTGQTERVSESSAGVQGNSESSDPSLSADGRYVAFYSEASNLVPGDTNRTGDIFVRDRLTGRTTRVSVSSTSAQGNGASSSPALSADGRFVAFESAASNLVPDDMNGVSDVFVRDCLTGQTERASVSSAGDQGNGWSSSPSLSADGRYVAFESLASNLVPGDTNGRPYVFVHDRLTGQTTRVSVNSAVVQGGSSSSWSPTLSADGRHVAFVSDANNLVPDDTNGSPDVFLHDRLTGQTERVPVSSAGMQGNDGSGSPSLSADGRFVTFESVAGNLVPDDANGHEDVFVCDRGVILATFPIHLALPDVTLNMAASAAFVTPGQPITYTLSFSNTWISTATGVLLTDVVPSTVTGLSYTSSGATVTPFPGSRYAWQVQDLAPGAGGVITLTGIVSPALTSAAALINTATITCTLDAEAANNTARTLAIVWLPDTLPQLIANTGLRLPPGAARAIGPAQLHVTDAESGPEAITYTLRVAPVHGALLLDGITLTVGARFTQAAIDAVRVRYAHDGVLAPEDSFTFSATDAGEPTTRVSVSSAGVQGSSSASSPALSADGRYVAFCSEASNLVPGDSNGRFDVFLRDRLTGQTERISVSSAGVQGNGRSWLPALSADGRYVAFCSEASNLVPGDSNGWQDVFLHDRLTGQTTRVSLSSAGDQGNFWSLYPSLSADGRYVAFYSEASNLVLGDTNRAADVFLHDRLTGQTERVSVNSAGVQGNDGSGYYPSLSADGRVVAFYSYASNLVPGDTNGTDDVFVHDRLTGQTTRASVSSAGVQGNDGSGYYPSLSADGRYVAFVSVASNLVPGDTNGYQDVFVHDRLTGQTERISLSSMGAQGNGASSSPALSADGRFVAFVSEAGYLAPGDSNGSPDVFVRDRLTGQTEHGSVISAGVQGNGPSGSPSLSADGRCVAFLSWASNFVPDDTNGTWDVFVRDRGVILAAFAIHVTPHDEALGAWVPLVLVHRDPAAHGIAVLLDRFSEFALLGPAPGALRIGLLSGWNLVSLPLAPANTAITQALSSVAGHYDLVYAYSAADVAHPWRKYNTVAPGFLNTLKVISETQGLWIRADSAVSLIITGTLPVSPAIALKQGWNLVGYPSQTTRPITVALASIDGQCDLVYAYDPASTSPWKKYNVAAPAFLNTLKEMGPGWGYWIRVKEDCVWQGP